MASNKKNANGLNDRQQAFCDAYLADPQRNGTAAAIAAGYSAHTATVQASTLLTHPNVSAYLESRQRKLLKHYEVTQERIVQELACIGFLDVAELFDEEGNILPIHEIPEHTRRAIAGMELGSYASGEGDTKKLVTYLSKLRLTDKKGALELLGKHHKMFTDKVEHTGKDGADLMPKMDTRELAKQIAFALAKGMKE